MYSPPLGYTYAYRHKSILYLKLPVPSAVIGKSLMRQALYSHEPFTVRDGCWFDEKAIFSSSKSFLEIHDSFVCCWFDAQAAFKSSRSLLEMRDALFCCSIDRTQFCKSSRMRSTASSNVEDSSYDALSSTVDR